MPSSLPGLRTTYSEELPADIADIGSCSNFVSLVSKPPRKGNTALVVSLSQIFFLAQREGISLQDAAAAALYGFLETNVTHVVLVPGTMGWSKVHADEVASAIDKAVDEHGVSQPTSLSCLSPAAIKCFGVGEVGSGVAWAITLGAQSILHLSSVSRFKRRSQHFSTSAPRLLPQIAAIDSAAAFDEWPLRKHFQACGGSSSLEQCDPDRNAVELCSQWLRPIVQYGLCHPASDYLLGRHSTVAANSPHDNTLYSGHRLLEEVSTITLPVGSVTLLSGLETDSAFSSPGRSIAVNRLVDRTVGWVLAESALVGLGGQSIMEGLLGLLHGNITVLPPGRLCNTSTDDENMDPAFEDAEYRQRTSEAARAFITGADMADVFRVFPVNLTCETLQQEVVRMAQILYMKGNF